MTVSSFKNLYPYFCRVLANKSTIALQGGQGNNVLTGGGGSDKFVYRSLAEGFDSIMDFSSNDEIRVAASGFLGGLQAGFNLSQAASGGVFVKSSNPSVTGNRATFLYNTSTGVLSYDRDGVGGQSATDLVKLANSFNLTSSQIVVV
jgi:Ca2+-binding RTX toxin-like protein